MESRRSSQLWPLLHSKTNMTEKPDSLLKNAFSFKHANVKKFCLGLIYGLVNVVLAIPVMYGYTTIIFSPAVYAPYMQVLAKLLLLSSALHQLTMSCFSGFPFAIGQVQDAGLIFLHKMTYHVAVRLEAAGEPPEVILATALLTTALSTLSLGFMMILIGKLKLARFVSFLPVPVVGGYLAFIGAFCLGAGVSLCTGIDIESFRDFNKFLHWHAILLVLPGLLVGAFLTWVGRAFRHAAALPLAIVGSILVFYVILLLGGFSLEEARSFGYVTEAATNPYNLVILTPTTLLPRFLFLPHKGEVTEPASFREVFDYFDFKHAHYSCILQNIHVWLGMVLVVSFSSCLDVAAIEMEMAKPVSYDSEIMTIGLANILSGCTGGFTGSYIFSQTIFTYRTRCNTRMIGLWVVLGEVILFFVYVDPLMYAPLYFFAAMLIFIAYDLMLEWLWEVRPKLTTWEYFILLCTFVTMIFAGLNIGILVGLALSVSAFVLSFASETMHIVKRVFKTSRILHPTSQRQLLGVHRDKILCIELRGELNFVSASKSLKQIMDHLGLPDKTTLLTEEAMGSKPLEQYFRAFFSNFWGEVKRRKKMDKTDEKRVLQTTHEIGPFFPSVHTIDVGFCDEELYANIESAPKSIYSSITTSCVDEIEVSGKGSASHQGSGTFDYIDIPSFVLLDCHLLTQIDATAAKSFFLPLRNLTEQHNIIMVFSGLSPKTRELLYVNGALVGERIKEFDALDSALEFCELSLIRAAVPTENSTLQPIDQSSMLHSRPSLFRENAISMENVLKLMLDLPESYSNEINDIGLYCKEVVYPKGSKLFNKNDPSECFLILLSGLIDVSESRHVLRPGSIFGYVEYQLEQRRSCTATAFMDCVVCVFNKSDVDRLEKDRPKLCMMLEKALLKHLAVSFASSGTDTHEI